LPIATEALPSSVSQVSFDLRIPVVQPNPYWIGAAQMFATIRSANVHNEYFGQVELTGLPRGYYTTLTFTIPYRVRAAMATNRQDVSLKIVLNINGNTPPYFLDNLRFF
jgi:hypothetical protein